ncbi:hypothetical protein GX50_07694 [[Emmonsia] crescens]|uniref:Altered inheritance of mitochondria protein 9, mitochondrial n=1 Tax=[Emmonsia] crescens TaxID=73230 RepID=A0A2B7Z965_9EURO|nr:hypothetical protein GX50_07694 [Emmonsia crescens]
MTAAPNNSELCEYTRARFLLGEVEQMAKRRIQFNMHELASTAAKAVGATRCLDIQKCPDGLYNKAFMLSMDTGKQVIAKIPNPNAGRPYYTTASEVATMDFARTVLETPVPQVYAWNASANDSNNSVGAEFIIMERVSGVPLSDIWWDLQPNQKLKVFAQVVRYMKRWTSVSFNGLGGLYFVEDVDTPSREPLYFEEGKPIRNSRFTIGPSSNREWSDEGRGDIQCDRGPWKSIIDYRRAIGDREVTAVKTLCHIPKHSAMLCGPEPLYQPTAEKKLEALRYYSQILETLLPEDPSLTTSHLWHNDLHHENIFVNPDSLQILGIIDWQSIQIAPLTDHCLDASFLDYEGPDIGTNLERPKLPAEIKSLNGEEKAIALKQYIDKAVMIAWRSLIRDKNPAQHRAIEFQRSASGNLLHLSRRIFELGEAHFRALLLDLRDERANAGPTSAPRFPFQFSDADVAAMEADVERAELGVRLIKSMEQRLGHLWPDKGIVEHENYDEAKSALRDVKAEFIDKHKAHSGWDTAVFERLWPFDD